MFTKAQLDRYARHMMLPGVGPKGQQKLLDSSVLVVGLGGLGSPLLLYLAAAGVGRIGLAEFDRVDISNLQRQVLYGSSDIGRTKVDAANRRLADLNPDIEFVSHPEKLTEINAAETVKAYDLVVDGTDNLTTRYLVNEVCVQLDKPLLYGAIAQFEGQVSLFNSPLAAGGRGPCYRCLYPSLPPPGVAPNCAEAGVFGVLPGVVGTVMATEAVKFLLELGEPLAGKLLHYDALYSEWRTVRFERRPACLSCGSAAESSDSDEAASESVQARQDVA